MERLTFNIGSSRRGTPMVAGPGIRAGQPASSRLESVRRTIADAGERYDWDYLLMLAFTALLFLRPQDHIPALEPMHLAELAAIAGLAAMAVRRLRAGQTITKINPEVIAVILLGVVIVLTIPFSFWPGGSLTMFTEIYGKVILIFALMMSTITTPRRLHQMTWLMIVASGYIAGRGVMDYLSGVNLVEGDRLRGAIGGIFKNPNDLALNLATFLAPTLFVIVQETRRPRRFLAALIAMLMLTATVFTKSRSGFLGLVAMGVVVFYYSVRVKPGIVVAVVLAGLLALPAMPESFWTRMVTIVNPEGDPTGSRAARIRLLNQGLEVFAENPLTGIGAGQFVNYNAPWFVEKWRATHNVWLQVAAELGVFGLTTFAFLVVRGYTSCLVTLGMLGHGRRRRQYFCSRIIDRPTAMDRPPALNQVRLPTREDPKGKSRRSVTPGPSRFAPAISNPRFAINEELAIRNQHSHALSEEDRRILDTNAKSMLAGLVGWTVCACFASVAFNWTFYYLLALAVAGREIAASRRTVPEQETNTTQVPRLVRAPA